MRWSPVGLLRCVSRLTRLPERECISGKYKVEDISVNDTVFRRAEAQHFRYKAAPARTARTANPVWYDECFQGLIHADREQLRNATGAADRRPPDPDVQPVRARGRGIPGSVAPAVLAQDSAGEPAPPRGRPVRQGRRHRGPGEMGRQERRAARNFVHARARPAPGFHRRAVRRRSRGHARRHRAPGRRPEQGQPAAARRARHRPFGPGGLLRAGRRV